jgi:hypothetical protein
MPGVVLLAGPGWSTRVLYNALVGDFDVAKVILERPLNRTAFLRKRLRKHGALTVGGQILFRVFCVPSLRAISRQRESALRREFGLVDTPIDPTKLVVVPSANAPETISRLQELAPSVVVINGTRILSSQLLEAVAAPFLNIHAGITPLYRGVHGAYWALVNDDRPHCGVTVHRVDARIDTGPVIFQELVHPLREDTFVTYPLLQLGAGVPLLKRAVGDALAGRLAYRQPPEGPSRLWTHPTVCEYFRHFLGRGIR